MGIQLRSAPYHRRSRSNSPPDVKDNNDGFTSADAYAPPPIRSGAAALRTGCGDGRAGQDSEGNVPKSWGSVRRLCLIPPDTSN